MTTGPGLPRWVLVYTSCHSVIIKSTPFPKWRILSWVPYAEAGLIFPAPLSIGVWGTTAPASSSVAAGHRGRSAGKGGGRPCA